IPVTANISGSFTNPKISTDLTSGVTNLTKQLIEIEKQKLIGKGTDKIKDLLGGVMGGNTNQTPETEPTIKDSTTTQTPPIKKDSTKSGSEAIKKTIKDIFNTQKKKKDTVN